MTTRLDSTILREYDIRGIVDQNLTTDIVELLGLRFARLIYATGSVRTVVIGCDARPSSEGFRQALTNGLCQGGVDVVDIGEVATPVLYFVLRHWNIPNGIVITGSHNPPEYNGLKLTKDYAAFAGSEIQLLAATTESAQKDEINQGKVLIRDNAVREYCQEVQENVVIDRPVRVVVDCGNGITGAYVPELYRALGCEVISLYGDVDGTFPNHHPDPTRPENLVDLVNTVREEEAEVGIAFDGDGDRVGIVTNTGETIWCDRLLAFFSEQILRDAPSRTVVYDVKCSKTLAQTIREAEGVPVMWKTGHTHIKQKMQEVSAILGAEFSGHICFGDRWFGFDDGPYAGARMIETLSKSRKSLHELFQNFPQLPATPELFMDIDEEEKFALISELQKIGCFDGGEVSMLDGVRVDYPDGFGLIRASNTSPKLTMRFEGESKRAIKDIHRIFQRELHHVDPSKSLPELIYV